MRQTQIAAGYFFCIATIPVFTVIAFMAFWGTVIGEDEARLFVVLAFGLPCAGYCSFKLAGGLDQREKMAHGYRAVVLGVVALLIVQLVRFADVSQLTPLNTLVIGYALCGVLVSVPNWS